MPDNLRPPSNDVLCDIAAGALCEAERDRAATYTEVARAVLAAVLPAHRAMVLQGAADFLDPGPRDPKPEGEMTSADWVRAAQRGVASNLRMWASPAPAHMWPPTPPAPPASTVEPENGPAVPDDGDGRAPNAAPPNTRPYCRQHGLDRRDDGSPSDQRWVHLGWIGQTGALYSLDEYPSAYEPRFYPLWGRGGIVILVPTQASSVAEPDPAEETP